MALAMPQTPQRPLPGGFVNTPAPSHALSQVGALTSSIFNRGIQASMAQSSGQQNGQGAVYGQQQQTQQPPQQQQQGQMQQQQQQQQSQQTASSNTSGQGLSLVERGARTISAALEQEAKYPALDNYISRKLVATMLGERARTDLTQRGSPLTTICHLQRPGRLSKRSRCTISRTRSSSNITRRRFLL